MYIIKAGGIFELSGGKETEFVSPFAQEYLDQENANWERNSWKQREPNDQAMVPRAMLWGGSGRQAKPLPPKATACFQRNDRLYYVLAMASSNGLFYFDRQTGQEMRLFHRAEFQPRGLFVCEDYSILSTVNNPDQTVHLLPLDANGRPGDALTSGDCIDENPYRAGDSIYYQSTGIARGEGGQVLAMSPIAINCLNSVTGDIDTVLSSESHDYLLPQVAPDGTLYCIQTPHTPAGKVSPMTILLDVVLFPYRLCVAIFGFLNMFTTFFAKMPLKTSGGPPTPEVDLSHRMLHHRMINIDAVQRRERKRVAVGNDWKLIRVRNGETTVVASHVLWYSLDGAGNPTYTDGFSVYDAGGLKRHECDGLVTAMGIALSEAATV